MSATQPADGQVLPEDARALRLPKPPPDFESEGWRPTWHQLEPSTGDKNDADTHNKPVRVSVWDDARTTREEARSFRTGPTIILGLSVADVNDVAAISKRLVRVVYDALDEPASARPGAEGHAGIEGLDRAKAEPKKQWRDMIEELASRAILLEGPE